jgi:hypothetical protein
MSADIEGRDPPAVADDEQEDGEDAALIARPAPTAASAGTGAATPAQGAATGKPVTSRFGNAFLGIALLSSTIFLVSAGPLSCHSHPI